MCIRDRPRPLPAALAEGAAVEQVGQRVTPTGIADDQRVVAIAAIVAIVVGGQHLFDGEAQLRLPLLADRGRRAIERPAQGKRQARYEQPLVAADQTRAERIAIGLGEGAKPLVCLLYTS